MARLRSEHGAQLDAALKLSGATQELADDFGTTVEALHAYQLASSESKKSTKELADEKRKAAEAAEKFRESIKHAFSSLIPFKAGLIDTATEVRALGGDMTDLASGSLAEYGEATTKARKEAEDWALKNGAVLAPSITAVGSATDDATTKVDRFAEVVRTRLAPAILAAFQGGGNVGKSIGGLIGGELLGPESGLNKMISGGLSKLLGAGAGKILGSFLPGVGTLIGGFLGDKLGGALGHLFGGVSPAVQKARDDVKAFQAELAKTLTATQKNEAGNEQWKMTLIRVRDAYLATGRSAADAEAIVKQLWDTSRPQQAAAAMQTITDVLKEQADQLEINKGKAQTLFDEIMQAGSEGIPAAYRPAIDQLIALGLLTDEQAEKLRGLGDSGAVNIDKMKAALDVFHGRVESLGPAFKQAEINKTATEYINAIETMTKGGGDLGMILEDSKEELSALVEDALKSGKTLPANMQPWIDQLFRQGDLIDKNGKKITDLSGLKYGDAIKTEGQKAQDTWDKILSAIQALVDKITGPLTKSIENLPDGHVKINVDSSELDRVGRGEYRSGERDRGTGFATGTMGVLGSWFGNFKSGTRAMLHGLEAVVPQRDAVPFSLSVLSHLVPKLPSPSAFASDMLAGITGGDTTTTTTNATQVYNNFLPFAVSQNPRDVAKQMTKHLVESGLPLDENGITSAFERVVENYLLTYGTARAY